MASSRVIWRGSPLTGVKVGSAACGVAPVVAGGSAGAPDADACVTAAGGTASLSVFEMHAVATIGTIVPTAQTSTRLAANRAEEKEWGRITLAALLKAQEWGRAVVC
jgi:hypothetical protein